jgi:hypothetical protein
MWITQKSTLWTYFLRNTFELITKFLHVSDNINKANWEGPTEAYSFPVRTFGGHIPYNTEKTFSYNLDRDL